jgi:hypothetical protein
LVNCILHQPKETQAGQVDGGARKQIGYFLSQ